MINIANNHFYTAAFAKAIRTLCQIHNLTIGQVAKRANVPRSVLYNAINNNQTVNVKNLIKLSDTFHVSVDWLLGRK